MELGSVPNGGVTPSMWHRSFAPGQVGRQWRGSTRVLALATGGIRRRGCRGSPTWVTAFSAGHIGHGNGVTPWELGEWPPERPLQTRVSVLFLGSHTISRNTPVPSCVTDCCVVTPRGTLCAELRPGPLRRVEPWTTGWQRC